MISTGDIFCFNCALPSKTLSYSHTVFCILHNKINDNNAVIREHSVGTADSASLKKSNSSFEYADEDGDSCVDEDGDGLSCADDDGDGLSCADEDGDSSSCADEDGDRLSCANDDGDGISCADEDGDSSSCADEDGDSSSCADEDGDGTLATLQHGVVSFPKSWTPHTSPAHTPEMFWTAGASQVLPLESSEHICLSTTQVSWPDLL